MKGKLRKHLQCETKRDLKPKTNLLSLGRLVNDTSDTINNFHFFSIEEEREILVEDGLRPFRLVGLSPTSGHRWSSSRRRFPLSADSKGGGPK